MHTISNSLGWVSIYTRASARCDSTFEIATEPLNLIFFWQASTDAAGWKWQNKTPVKQIIILAV
jgi:hypothetical protein